MTTSAIRALKAAGIPHAVGRFDPALTAMEAAAALELPPAALLKTLACASMRGVVLVCLSADRTLDLAALRQALAEPRTALIGREALERMTGFRPGAVTPIPVPGERRFSVHLDRAALAFARVGVGAGEAGTEILLAPDDLVRATGATIAPLSEPPRL